MISMDRRVIIFLFVVGNCWSCNARDLTANHVTGRGAISTVLQSDDKLYREGAQPVGEVIKNKQLCTFCEEYATKALNYLSDNKTQSEIMKILHKSCSELHTYKQQCISLVDYYAPLFFLEASKLHAEEFCRKFGLCGQGISISHPVSKDTCSACRNVVAQALTKLKDPDTEIEIVQLLLKACDSIGKSVKMCKRWVFEYAPIFLVNAEQFLERNDVCSILHVCDSTTVVVEDVSASLHSAA